MRDLSLGKNNNKSHQNAGTQSEEAVSLMLCFCLRQEMSGPNINQGAQERFVNSTDEGEFILSGQRVNEET